MDQEEDLYVDNNLDNLLLYVLLVVVLEDHLVVVVKDVLDLDYVGENERRMVEVEVEVDLGHNREVVEHKLYHQVDRDL